MADIQGKPDGAVTIQKEKKRIDQESFLKYLAMKGTVSEAVSLTGICKDTYYHWMKEKQFKYRVDEALLEFADKIEKIFFETISFNPKLNIYHPSAIMFALRGLKPQKYMDRSKIELPFKVKLRDIPGSKRG